MKKFLKMFSLVFVLALSVFAFSACTKSKDSKEPVLSIGLEYTLINNDTEYELSSIGTCKDAHIVIPSSYEGKPVISIGYEAFRNCYALTSITIPNSVTSIEIRAFEDCISLTSIVIESATIANEMKYGSSCGEIASCAETVYIKTGLDTSNSSYLLVNFAKQETSDKTGYNMYVRNAE